MAQEAIRKPAGEIKRLIVTEKDARDALGELVDLEQEAARREPEIKGKVEELEAPLKELIDRAKAIRSGLADFLGPFPKEKTPIIHNGNFFLSVSRPGPKWSVTDPELAMKTAIERKDWKLLNFAVDEAALRDYLKETRTMYPGTDLVDRPPFIQVRDERR